MLTNAPENVQSRRTLPQLAQQMPAAFERVEMREGRRVSDENVDVVWDFVPNILIARVLEGSGVNAHWRAWASKDAEQPSVLGSYHDLLVLQIDDVAPVSLPAMSMSPVRASRHHLIEIDVASARHHNLNVVWLLL